jgi:hypothetical protein
MPGPGRQRIQDWGWSPQRARGEHQEGGDPGARILFPLGRKNQGQETRRGSVQEASPAGGPGIVSIWWV